MAKKQEPAKPLFPLQHDYWESLKNYQHKADMLATAVSTLLTIGSDVTGMSKQAQEMLQEHLREFNAARHSE